MSLVLLQDLVNKNSTFKLTHHHLTLHFFSGWFYQDQGRQSNISISLTSAVCFTCDQVGKDHKNMIQTNNVSSLVQRSFPLLYLLFKICWFIAASEADYLLHVLRHQPTSVTPKISREQYHQLYWESWKASTDIRTLRVSQTNLGSRGLRYCTVPTTSFTCTQFY